MTEVVFVVILLLHKIKTIFFEIFEKGSQNDELVKKLIFCDCFGFDIIFTTYYKENYTIIEKNYNIFTKFKFYELYLRRFKIFIKNFINPNKWFYNSRK